MTRVAVFIDYQNVYMQARRTFHLLAAPHMAGQVYPRRLGVLLTDKGREVDAERELSVVRVYRGEPSAKHSPKGQAACQRQLRYWSSQAAVEPVTRPLHYYHRGVDKYGKDIWEAREKGIDVLLALGMVVGAVRDLYDVCVLCSGDTDLVPAMEAVLQEGKRCEVMAWKSRDYRTPRLKVDDGNVWCHWLEDTDFARVHDPSDYTQPLAPPVADP